MEQVLCWATVLGVTNEINVCLLNCCQGPTTFKDVTSRYPTWIGSGHVSAFFTAQFPVPRSGTGQSALRSLCRISERRTCEIDTIEPFYGEAKSFAKGHLALTWQSYDSSLACLTPEDMVSPRAPSSPSLTRRWCLHCHPLRHLHRHFI